jgi:hypothetical protein
MLPTISKWIKNADCWCSFLANIKKMAGITALAQVGQYRGSRMNRHKLFLSLEYADKVHCGKLQPFPTFGRNNIIRITA